MHLLAYFANDFNNWYWTSLSWKPEAAWVPSEWWSRKSALGPLSLWDGIQTAWETAATSTPAPWLYSCLFHTRGVFIWCQGNCNRRVGLCVLLFLWVVHGSDAYHLPSSGGGWWRSPGRNKYTYRWLLQPPCMLRRWKLDLIMKSLLCVHSLFMPHLPLNVCVNESL